MIWTWTIQTFGYPKSSRLQQMCTRKSSESLRQNKF